ncbi:MAG TPA: hypothetical protein VGH74_09650 [Planctomycetaceae bacterium]|jgi:hypothetical protein
MLDGMERSSIIAVIGILAVIRGGVVLVVLSIPELRPRRRIAIETAVTAGGVAVGTMAIRLLIWRINGHKSKRPSEDP